MSEVPTIDLSQVDDRSLELIDRACRDHGFFLAVGHGMDGHLAALMDKAKAFFDLPKEEKRKVLRTADNPMGYFDRELTKQKRDQKEVFDFYAPRAGAGIGRMRWPEQPEGFREVLSDYFHASAGVAKLVMALLCRAIGQPASVLDEAFSGSPTNTARLNHYPPEDLLSVDERKDVKPLGDMALHHHTDPGAVTLLYQDQVGGLETYSREDGWIPVPPNPDALVVNVGDVVQVWSNGQYRAAVHRVVPVPAGTSRYSMPFFYQPCSTAMIEPIKALGAPRYRPFTWKEFIQGRIDDNFAPVGEEDIQVEKYRIAS